MKERIIKRYANRKMYDTDESRYVSLQDLAEMVRSGETIRVINKEDGEDQTVQVLRQIILDQEKGRDGPSASVLHEWVRMGSSFIDLDWKELRDEAEAWVKKRLTPLSDRPARHKVSLIKEKLEELERKIDLLETLDNPQIKQKKKKG